MDYIWQHDLIYSGSAGQNLYGGKLIGNVSLVLSNLPKMLLGRKLA